jgi:hypothetical protein
MELGIRVITTSHEAMPPTLPSCPVSRPSYFMIPGIIIPYPKVMTWEAAMEIHAKTRINQTFEFIFTFSDIRIPAFQKNIMRPTAA